MGRAGHDPRALLSPVEGTHDATRAHLARVAAAVLDDQASHPARIRLLGPDAVVFEPHPVAQLVEKPRRATGHGRLLQDAFARPS